MRGLGSITIGGNILPLFFLFSRSKASDANIGIIASVVCVCENIDRFHQILVTQQTF